MRIGCPFPFIGPLLYRIRRGRLITKVRKGNASAIRELIEDFASSPGRRPASEAEAAFRSLFTSEQIDIFCHEAIARNDPLLFSIACECNYFPSDPGAREVFSFCSGQPTPDQSQEADPDSEKLAKGYLAAGPLIRWQCRNAARRDGTCTELARALCSTGTAGTAGWSREDWEIVIAGLTQEGQWQMLWKYLPHAPVTLAIDAAVAMRDAAWVPPGDDRMIWAGITAALPPAWTYPVRKDGLLPEIGRPAAHIIRAAFSWDGSLLAGICPDGTIRVIRISAPAGGTLAGPGAGPTGFPLITRDNDSIICGECTNIACYHLPDMARIWTRENGSGANTICLASPENQNLLIGDNSGAMVTLDSRDGRVIDEKNLHPSPITAMAVSVDVGKTACGHGDGTVSIVSARSGAPSHLAPGSPDPVTSLAFSSDGKECLVLHERSLPVLWDAGEGTRSRVFTGHTGSALCAAISAEGRWFAIGSSDHTLRIWSWGNAAPEVEIPLYRRRISCCTQDPDGQFLIAGFGDGTIRIWRIPGAILVKEIKAHKKAIASCTMSPDGTSLATISGGGILKLWRIPKMEILRTDSPHAGTLVALAGWDNGGRIATVTGDGIARIHNADDGSLIRSIDLYTPSVRAVAVSTDGSFLACTGTDASIRIWDLRTAALISSPGSPGTSLWCCAFLPGGDLLFCGGWDGRCRLFSTPEGKSVAVLAGHRSIVTCCAVSLDGSLVATGSNDTTVRLWNPATGRTIQVLEDSESEISSVAISPDGLLLAAGGSDARVRLYVLPYGEPAGDLPGVMGRVTALAFDGDRCILVVGYDSGLCAFFALQEQKLIRTAAAHAGPVTGIVVLKGGRSVATSGEDGLVRYLPLPDPGFLPGATPADLLGAAQDAESSRNGPDALLWECRYLLLAARFRGEIQLCPDAGTIGQFDIQISG